MAIGNPINLTSNVEGKNISVIATAGQTQFTVTGGYRINQISVFRNGVRLVDGRDFTAADGATVTLLSAATVADVLEFQVFDDFRVSDALNVNSGGTVNGDVTVTGIVSTTNLSIGSSISLDATSGIVTAVQFVGDITGTATTATNASGLTGTPDITVNNIVAAAATFSGVLTYEDVTNIDSLGIVTARTGVDITANGLVVNAGVSTFGADLSIADKIIHSGDTNTAIRFPSADTFTVETAGVQRLEVDSSGDLGLVGIATATGLVVVAGSGGYAGHTGIITAVTFDGALSGAATQVTVADESSDTTCFPLFVTAATGDLAPKSGTNLAFNSSSGRLDATQFNGNFVGGTVSGTTGTFSSDVDIADKIVHTGDTNTAIRFPAGDTFSIETGAIEALRVDSSQRLLVTGGNTTTTVSGFRTNLQVAGTGADSSSIMTGRFGDNASAPFFIFHKSRNASFNGNTIVQDDDILGRVAWYGADGTDYEEAAHIQCQVDGTPSDGTDMPGRLVFATTPDGDHNATERLRITSAGLVGVNCTPLAQFQVKAGTNANISLTTMSSEAAIEAYNDAGSANVTLRLRASDFKFFTSATERLTLDSSGRLLINTTTSRIVEDHVGNGPQGKIQIEATNSDAIMSIISAGTADANRCGTISLGRHRNSTVGGTPTIVQDGDALGAVMFSAGDGTDMRTAGAKIHAEVDGTPGSNDMPGALIFSTTPDGSSTPGSSNERLRIDSSGRLLQGKGATKGSTGENVPTYCTEIANTNNPNVLEIANNGTASGSYSALVLSRSDGTSVNSHTAVDSGDKIGEVCFIGADGSDRFNTAASMFVEAEADFTANDCPARLILATNAGGASATERLRINSLGTFDFTNGALIEEVQVTSGKLSDNVNINLDNGMVYLFTTAETTTSTPNIRINSSNTLDAAMGNGKVISLTIMTTAAAAGYFTTVEIDGNANGENSYTLNVDWLGGSAPSAGGSSGIDVYNITIIKQSSKNFNILIAQNNYA